MADTTKTQETTETISIEEAMQMLDLSRTSIYKRIEKGELIPLPKPPAHKKRKETRFYRKDVEKLLQS